jgi:hypothetical protein
VTAAEAMRRLTVYGGYGVVAQAFAGTLTLSLERDATSDGYLARGSSVVCFHRSREAALHLWRALLEAKRMDGEVVTEPEESEDPHEYKKRHVAALLAAGRIQP